MRLLILFSFVAFALAEELWFFSQDSNYRKSKLETGRFFKHGYTVKTTHPMEIAIYIEGNGVKDEVKVKIDELDEVSELNFSDHINTIVARMWRKKIALLSQDSEPNVLVVVEGEKCSKRSYGTNKGTTAMQASDCKKIYDMMRQLDFHERPNEVKEEMMASLQSRRSQMLYYKPDNPKLSKWREYFGGLYYFGTTLDTATTPLTLGLYIRGNDVEDELYVRLDSKDDVSKLKAVNGPDTLTVDVPGKDYKIICKRKEPGSMVVIKSGVCKRLRHDPKNPAKNPTEEDVDGSICKDLIQEVDSAKLIILSQIWFIDGDMPEERLKSYKGQTFDTGLIVVVDEEHSRNKYTLGMFIGGNGVLDEIHVELDNYYQYEQVSILNDPDRAMFWLDSKNIAIVAKANEYGIVVIENGECKRRIYDENRPLLKPTEEVVLKEECQKYFGEVTAAFPTMFTNLWYPALKHGQVTFRHTILEPPPPTAKSAPMARPAALGRYPWMYRTASPIARPPPVGFKYAYVFNYEEKTEGSAFTIGVYIQNYQTLNEDEIYLDAKSREEANELKAIKQTHSNGSEVLIIRSIPQRFAVIANSSFPNKLIVIHKGVCTRKMFRKQGQSNIVPARWVHNESEIPSKRCDELMKSVELEVQ